MNSQNGLCNYCGNEAIKLWYDNQYQCGSYCCQGHFFTQDTIPKCDACKQPLYSDIEFGPYSCVTIGCLRYGKYFLNKIVELGGYNYEDK